MGSSAPAARLCPGSELWPGEGLATPPAAKGRRPLPTHRDDVVLAEAQLVVVMALEVQQGLGSARVAARAGHVVLVVPLVALHAVVRGQLLPGRQKGHCSGQGSGARSSPAPRAGPRDSPHCSSWGPRTGSGGPHAGWLPEGQPPAPSA